MIRTCHKVSILSAFLTVQLFAKAVRIENAITINTTMSYKNAVEMGKFRFYQLPVEELYTSME
jgi:hypothetical protein